MIEAECHVPGLCCEYGKDAGAFDTEQAPREKRKEAGDRDRKKSEHGHRLQNVEQRQHELARTRTLGRDVAIGESKQERRGKSDEHSQHGARRVIGDELDIQGELRWMQLVEAHPHVAAQNNEEPEQHEDGQDDNCVDPAVAPAARNLLSGRFRVGPRRHIRLSKRLAPLPAKSSCYSKWHTRHAAAV